VAFVMSLVISIQRIFLLIYFEKSFYLMIASHSASCVGLGVDMGRGRLFF
jgi:hypothetical protein